MPFVLLYVPFCISAPKSTPIALHTFAQTHAPVPEYWHRLLYCLLMLRLRLHVGNLAPTKDGDRSTTVRIELEVRFRKHWH